MTTEVWANTVVQASLGGGRIVPVPATTKEALIDVRNLTLESSFIASRRVGPSMLILEARIMHGATDSGPASRRSTETLLFSVNRLARTDPPAPPKKLIRSRSLSAARSQRTSYNNVVKLVGVRSLPLHDI